MTHHKHLASAGAIIPTVLAVQNPEYISMSLAYLLFAVAGGTAGFARFLRSSRQWRWRVVLSFALFGALASVVVIGLSFGNEVYANPWKCLSYSLVIGFAQPEFAGIFVQNTMKALGLDVQMEK